MTDRKPYRPRKNAPQRQARPVHRFASEIDHCILYGFHAVVEALRNPARHPRRLMLTENAAKRLAEEGIDMPLQPEMVRPGEIDRLLTPDAVHQGMLLECDPLPSPDLENLPHDGLILVLDQITDPHNVGAIIRTAAAFKVDAIIMTIRHSPAATGVLAKSASGGLEHVPLISVTNLSRALETLGEHGYQRVGLDSEGAAPLDEVELKRPLALVLGAEGKGLRQKTGETCDVLARLDMPGAIKSLNVSNAAAISLHVAVSRTK